MIRVSGFPAPAGALDLEVQAGEVVLLRGANGSGKTSLLRALAGLETHLAPRSVQVHGQDPRCLPAAQLAGLIAFSPQHAGDGLAGLTVAGEARLRRRELPTPLAPLAHRDVTSLSSGEGRKVVLGILPRTGVLLLDEPAEGLDAAGRDALRRTVLRARESGAAVIAADHGGVLDDVATRTVHLDAPSAVDDLALPEGADDEVLSCAPRDIVRGDRRLRLPALRLGSGFHAVSGANGSGKSTLLLRLAGLLDAEGVRVAGAPPLPGRSVRLALPHAKDLFRHPRVADELRTCDPQVRDALVPDPLLPRHPLTLSGGEAQRVLLAKTLGTAAPLYLLDEPEAFLDREGRRQLVACMTRRIREGACIVAATHDPAMQGLARTTIPLEVAE